MPRLRFAPAVQKHVLSGVRRGGLAKVEGLDLVLEANDRKPTAAEVARLRVNHREGQRRGHCGVHRVAARAEDLQAGCRGRRDRARDRAASPPYSLGVGRVEPGGTNKKHQRDQHAD